jgi:hypothetical protein
MAPCPNYCAYKPSTLCIIRQLTFKTINYIVMKLCKIAEERSLWSLSPKIESIFRKTNLRVKGENHQLFIACASHPCRFQIERKKEQFESFYILGLLNALFFRVPPLLPRSMISQTKSFISNSMKWIQTWWCPCKIALPRIIKFNNNN